MALHASFTKFSVLAVQCNGGEQSIKVTANLHPSKCLQEEDGVFLVVFEMGCQRKDPLKVGTGAR